MKNTLTVKQKEADQDLNIIAVLTILSLIGYIIPQKQILSFLHQTELPIWSRLLFLATLQFCVAGLGTSVVMILRKKAINNMVCQLSISSQPLFRRLLSVSPYFFFSSVEDSFIPISLFNPSSLPKKFSQVLSQQMSWAFSSLLLFGDSGKVLIMLSLQTKSTVAFHHIKLGLITEP